MPQLAPNNWFLFLNLLYLFFFVFLSTVSLRPINLMSSVVANFNINYCYYNFFFY